MIIRSKAPLRIGLAGGGTDVSPFADLYGGAILNATVNKYAYANIMPKNDGKIVFHAVDRGERLVLDSQKSLPLDGELALSMGVYNRLVRDFDLPALSFECLTYVDAPPGSGLGSSSTFVVALVGAFAKWLGLPLGNYDMAHLAFEIERQDLAMEGGRQDQYAATFGGFNFMEFYKDDKVIVNPLRIDSESLYELENNLLLFYTESSRFSSDIIRAQSKNVEDKREKPIAAMHKLKEQAVHMKEALLRGEIDRIGEVLNFGWNHKKQMADAITTPELENVYERALAAGATGGKISGAGGGGFMIFYCPGNTRFAVREALSQLKGSEHPYQFVKNGLITWAAP